VTDSPSVGTFTSLAISSLSLRGGGAARCVPLVLAAAGEAERLRHQLLLLLDVLAGEPGRRAGGTVAPGIARPHAGVARVGQRLLDAAFDEEPGAVVLRFLLAPDDLLEVRHPLQPRRERLAGERIE